VCPIAARGDKAFAIKEASRVCSLVRAGESPPVRFERNGWQGGDVQYLEERSEQFFGNLSLLALDVHFAPIG
jgi:hypothetical protein